ncbi:MAG TPA: TonB family protein, partial [Candidatus Obscuribacterales bacterium]
LAGLALSLATAGSAVAQVPDQRPATFKLHAVVFDGALPGAGSLSHSVGPFWSHDGVGDGQTIAVSEEKKGAPAVGEPAGGGDAAQESKQSAADQSGPGTEKPQAGAAPSSASSKDKTGVNSEASQGSAAQTQAKPAGASRPGKLEGTGVDWSQWANELADRWYKNLIALERKSGKGFNTARPAKIRFTCYPDGSIKNISLYRSCGISEYDRMQIEALKQVQPLPPFPPGTRRKSITMLQGWASGPKTKGQKDFELGSYGKRMPVERVRTRPKPKSAGTGGKAQAKPAAPSPSKR